MPSARVALRRNGLGAGADARAAISRVARIEDDKAGIVYPAVGIFEANRVLAGLERLADDVLRQIKGCDVGGRSSRPPR